MRFHHIGIYVDRLSEVENFYCNLYGFHVEQRFQFMGEEITFISRNEVKIELIKAKEIVPASEKNHFALEVDSVGDWLEKLAKKGIIPVEGPHQLDNDWKVVFFQGLNKEIIELIQVK